VLIYSNRCPCDAFYCNLHNFRTSLPVVVYSCSHISFHDHMALKDEQLMAIQHVGKTCLYGYQIQQVPIWSYHLYSCLTSTLKRQKQHITVTNLQSYHGVTPHYNRIFHRIFLCVIICLFSLCVLYAEMWQNCMIMHAWICGYQVLLSDITESLGTRLMYILFMGISIPCVVCDCIYPQHAVVWNHLPVFLQCVIYWQFILCVAMFYALAEFWNSCLHSEHVLHTCKKGHVCCELHTPVPYCPLSLLFSSPKQSFLSKADFSPLLHPCVCKHIQAASRAREEFDPAFHYRSYVWITLGWYRHLWWTVGVAQDDQVNCTDAELDTLLERSIAVQYFPTAENRTAPTDVSLVSVMCRCGDVIYVRVWTLRHSSLFLPVFPTLLH